jgi:hypothetical protein
MSARAAPLQQLQLQVGRLFYVSSVGMPVDAWLAEWSLVEMLG